MPEHVRMAEIEIITDGGRRHYWTAVKRLRNVEETLDDQSGISVVVRRNGDASNLLCRWRGLVLEARIITTLLFYEPTRRACREAAFRQLVLRNCRRAGQWPYSPSPSNTALSFAFGPSPVGRRQTFTLRPRPPARMLVA